MFPGAGELADGISGFLYVVEGDLKNASFSWGSMIPIAGWVSTTSKWAGYIVKYQNRLHHLTLTLKNGLITFGARSKLRDVLNIIDANLEAHHVIP